MSEIRHEVQTPVANMLTPRKLSARSPAKTDSVIRVEMKLNREEAARLQETNAHLEKEVNQLRETQIKIKEEVKQESRRRKKLFLEQQQANDDEMRALKKSFADSKSRLEEARNLSRSEKINTVSENISEMKSVTGSLKSIIDNTVSDVTNRFRTGSARMHAITDTPADPEVSTYRSIEIRLQSTLAALPQASELGEFRTRPSVELDNLVVFEAPQEEPEQETHVIVRNVYKFVPLHLVRAFKWIHECLQ